ncbi:MAG TPA: Na+/H+ antiporter NhaA, partial [Gammaproteobacteria bacterium]|nr:Na+/H+ antiporter NhaA [Gammaproteobacteria bacterium]
IYVLFNEQDAFLLRAWAVPTATDIAFSLAVLSFVGSRAPFGLKAYLTALAIFDDVAAIIIIAFFYTDRIDTLFLGCSLVCLFLLFLFNKIRLAQLSPYLLLGFMLWFCFLKAGIHPTLAGVLTAFMVPLETKNKKKFPLQKLQQGLHPWVAIVILPLFALMNAGVSFTHFNQAEVQLTVLLGTFFGLFLGKQLGIFGASWLAVKARLAALPDQIRWPELYAVAVICGIGFTISLFIGNLAFNPGHEVYLNSLKIGILTGSLLSGCIGYLLLLHLR